MSDKREVRLIDAISRRAVLDRLEMLRRNYTLKAGYRDAMTDAIGEVRDALTIDAVPVVHGHWIKVLGGNGLVSTIRCSECGNCDNLMEKKNYDLTQITRILLEMCDNCVPKDGEAYDDPKRMEKYDAINSAIDLINNPSLLVTGDTSDGYHTFNELYHHRAVLFSVIVKAFPDRAWKARKHHDGSMYDGMFIVGIETPDGQATYHYDIKPYWYMFECKELEYAPEWDGHTPAQAIARIGKLEPVRHGRWVERGYACGESEWECTSCGNTEWRTTTIRLKWCPNCGAKMDGGKDDENA